MSHFTVMVTIPKSVIIDGDIDTYLNEVLEPYNENLGVEPYIDLTIEELKLERDSADKKYPEKGYGCMSLEEFAEYWYSQKLDSEGNLMSTYNPNSKWDWWEVGGRWSNMVILKDGRHSDFAQIKDIDFEGIYNEERKNRAKNYDKAMNKTDITPEMISFIYGITPDMTKDEYVNNSIGFQTYAVIDKEGNWLSKGEMGWFAMGSETEEESKKWNNEFYECHLSCLDPEDGIIIVDCHI